MIIRRYLAHEVFFTTLIVVVVLLAISLGGRVISYLQDAAGGLLSTDVLLAVILYRIPGLLEIIIPIAFFLGIILGYGRLRMDSEMIVLEACGMKPTRIIGETMLFAAVMSLIVGVISLLVWPWSQAQIEKIWQEQESLTEFDLLTPGRFQSMDKGNRVTYAQKIDSDDKRMRTVFVATRAGEAAGDQDRVDVVMAQQGTQQTNRESGNRFLVLHNGTRSFGTPGDARYRTIEYQELGQLIESTAHKRRPKISAMTTAELWNSADLERRAELEWRISIVLLVPIASFMAIPLSRVNPRQDRFARLVPSLILIFLYFVLLSISQNWVEHGTMSPQVGMWWVHLLFLAIALLIYRSDSLLDRAPAPAKTARARADAGSATT